MDAQTLSEAMGGSLSLAEYEELLPGYENAMHAAGINNVNRAAMFAAQLGHESSGLFHMEEIHDGSNYEWRGDLGNIFAGDGVRYKGRGPIQLTGRSNYRAFTGWTQAEGHSTIDFEAEPERLEEPHWGFLAAAWYWTQARPNLNRYADAGDVFSASCDINGWIKLANGSWRTPNGYQDRLLRWNRALPLGNRLLPGGVAKPAKGPHEIQMEYSRDNITQLTPWNCGPASTETAIQAATGEWVSEVKLASELGTHRGGTDWIGQFPDVLNRHIPGGEYTHAEMPNDPPNSSQKEKLWEDLTGSVDAGHPVIVNIVAPPSNYPKAVAPSTISPAYSGGTIYHYIAALGYAGTGGSRRVWIADSGFAPFGYWIGFDQLSTLIPPKGYAYSTAAPLVTPATEPTFLEELMAEKVPSFVNPAKEFDGNISLALIDRATWENRALLNELFDALGLDADKTIADAIAADREGK